MKIARYEQIISPEVGTTIAGYGAFDETFRKSDDLVVSLLALDDGKNTALILGYDLIGMDEKAALRIFRSCCSAELSGYSAGTAMEHPNQGMGGRCCCPEDSGARPFWSGKSKGTYLGAFGCSQVKR